MADNLTAEFKEELKKRTGATDAQLEKYLQSKNAQQVFKNQPTAEIEGRTHINEAIPPVNQWYTDPDRGERSGLMSTTKEDLFHSVGEALWDYADVATFTAPSVIANYFDIDPLEELGLGTIHMEDRSALGKVTGTLAHAAGFLQPMKWISKAYGHGIKRLAPTGTNKLIGKVLHGKGAFKPKPV